MADNFLMLDRGFCVFDAIGRVLKNADFLMEGFCVSGGGQVRRSIGFARTKQKDRRVFMIARGLA